MLFGEGKRSFSALWATHPPLIERIQALEPGFRPAEIKQLRNEYRADPPNGMAEDAALGLVSGPAGRRADRRGVARGSRRPGRHVQPRRPGPRGRDQRADPGRAASARQPAEHGDRASSSRCCSTDDDARPCPAGGDDRTGRGAARIREVADLPELLRLPLIGIAMSAVVARPPQQADRLVATIDEVAKADGTYSLFEYCASRLVTTYLLDARDPVRRSRPGRASVRQVQDAALTLLAAIAAAGNSDPGSGRARLRRGGGAADAGRGRPAVQPAADRVRARRRAGRCWTRWTCSTSARSSRRWWPRSTTTACSPSPRPSCCAPPARCCTARCPRWSPDRQGVVSRTGRRRCPRRRGRPRAAAGPRCRRPWRCRPPCGTSRPR